ncbi:hypothetical protein I6A84_23800 [Frankia sp. CNm7]|uniref:Uncharacterized protein n=1 Tax=Frankia nepalensis TaxID=1836974 RepID=A0A937REC2_9ACTN|nr:hypothetical protein [Frankia nepalensis]MBL7499233.1 hypothetical protein [Frankia nepalensis]MBL7512121.1 hypothetical protein [Frankia nepalensis]MBL7521030.1 hypothetical protein [Frankia nepalensis]MBL7627304.1 hypothetical protein [Frankia nepalensis]
MAATVKAGSRLTSQVCETQVIVVRPGGGSLELGCGGAPLIAHSEAPAPDLAADPALLGGSQLGKRFVLDGEDSLELLVTRSGRGTLTANGVPLVEKQAARLPSSD